MGSLIMKLDNPRGYFPRLDLQPAHRNGQLEPLRSRAARIEIEHVTFHFLLGNVAVAVNHSSKPGCFGLQIKLLDDVEDINRDAGDRENIHLRKKRSRPSSAVHVAAHGRDGRNLVQFRKNRRISDIARVDYRVRLSQSLDRFGAQQSVGV